jgi:hypothetical protein
MSNNAYSNRNGGFLKSGMLTKSEETKRKNEVSISVDQHGRSGFAASFREKADSAQEQDKGGYAGKRAFHVQPGVLMRPGLF